MTIYDTNVAALKLHHPELFDLTTQSISAEHIHIELAKTGMPRLIVHNQSGEMVALHDPEDPVSVAEGTAEHMALTFQGVTVSLGLELGYFARAMTRRLRPGSRLVVYEADPAIFLTAIREVDLTEVLNSTRVKIVVGPEGRLRHWCTRSIEQTNGDLRVVSYEPAFRLAPEAYGEKAEKELERIPSIVKAGRNALLRRGSMFIDSVLANAPHIFLAQGVSSLKDRFMGVPAFLVAAGPSLEKNVHQLKAAKHRSVIIAADTALGYLLARNIVPDFVVSVDPQQATYRKYQGFEIPSEVALVFHPSATPQIPQHFPGPKFTMDATNPVYRWLQEFWGSKGALDTECMCQVHVGFNLAEWMGCNPIVLVGQDLCFSEERMHVKDGGYLTDSEAKPYLINGQPIHDIFGEPVKTNPTFLNYKSILEKKIRQFHGRVIHATEGGLPLEGTELYLLRDAIAEFCQGPSRRVVDQIGSNRGESLEIAWIPLLREVRMRIRDLFRVGRTSRHVSRVLERMKERWESSHTVDEEFQQLGRIVERLTRLIPRYQKARQLVHWMDVDLERQLMEDTQILESLSHPHEKHEQQIARGLRYYGGLARVAPLLLEKLQGLSRRLEQWQVLQAQIPQPDGSPKWIEVAEGLAGLDLHGSAAECLAHYVHEKNGQSLLLEEALLAIRLPLEQCQLTHAVARAEIARDIFPESPDVIALCSQVNCEYRQWQRKVAAAQADEPSTVDAHLQAGDFYHRIGDVARAQSHYRLAAEEKGGRPDEAWDFFSRKDQEPNVNPEDQATMAGS